MSQRLGVSGAIARKFLHSRITPLLALVGLLLGVFAVAVTPREEEPQINVTFANVFIPFPGASASEVEHLVTVPAEQVLSEIQGVKHIYSTSRPGMAVLTVEYKVGDDLTQAIVRLYNDVFSKQDWLPPNLGTLQPIIKPKGIDDVPVVTVTLWSEDPHRGAGDLLRVGHAVEAELKRVPGTRDIYTIGGPDAVVRELLDPPRLAGHGIGLPGLQIGLRQRRVGAQRRGDKRPGQQRQRRQAPERQPEALAPGAAPPLVAVALHVVDGSYRPLRRRRRPRAPRQSRAASTSIAPSGSPTPASRTMARLRYRCAGCSHVMPMPPCS